MCSYIIIMREIEKDTISLCNILGKLFMRQNLYFCKIVQNTTGYPDSNQMF